MQWCQLLTYAAPVSGHDMCIQAFAPRSRHKVAVEGKGPLGVVVPAPVLALRPLPAQRAARAPALHPAHRPQHRLGLGVGVPRRTRQLQSLGIYR